ncbi:hypothetical protein MN116_004317 [Schistosoma mekongi]|uniref:G-protein-signaling modulator 2 n=1 Tax=Schistosoma mekongi TaxID=38744 RepID=A0AAE1ZFR3_SCHME|nr:hypothetical protein MN116_004317 [Schistosoma mekongi]
MTHSNLATSMPCLYLAVEGERFCREGDWNKGISLFLKALSIGTDDLSCLSVIYCQLGNAYFYKQDYTRALEYHRWNLALARRMGNGIGEAFATGNLGNTLQMMGKYDEAIMCFTHELIIARQLDDKRTEAGALYNLGNVYQSIGKQWLPDSGEFPVDAVKAQRKAAEYYKMGLELIRTFGDRPAEGRALGSLANVYYLLSNFTEAIECYKERLKIAKEFGDLAAQRRAHSNIGNAFIFLADFNSAVEHYREALRLSVHLKDTSLEAQACFSLGNTYILLRDPGTAVVFLLRHLVIARGLLDRIGEGRAHWSLANAYTAMKKYDLALRCSKRHRRIARQLSDSTGYTTAQLMIGEIRSLMISKQTECSTLIGQQHEEIVESQIKSVTRQQQNCCLSDINDSKLLLLDENIPFLTKHKLSYGTYYNNNNHDNDDDDDDLDLDLDKDLEKELLENYEGILETVEFVTVTEDGQTVISQMGCLDVPTPVLSKSKKENMVEFYLSAPAFRPNLSQQIDIPNLGDIEGNLESIESMPQMNRMNPNLSNENVDSGNAHNTATTSATTACSSTVAVTAASLVEEERSVDQQETFFSLLLESQSRRMDEQRCYLRTSQGTPPTQSTETTSSTQELSTIHLLSANSNHMSDNDNSSLRNQIGTNEEAFFDLIEGVQGDRMNDQRANLSVFPGLRSGPGLHILDNSNTNTTLTNNRYFGSTNSVFKSTSSCASDGLPEPKFYSTSSNSGGVTGFLTDNSTVAAVSSTRTGSGDGVTRVGGSNAGNPHGRRGQLVSSTGDLDDEFLEMIFRIQTCTRINDQRSNLPDPLSQSIQSHVNPPTYNCSNVSGQDSRGNGQSTRTATSTVTTTIASNSHRELTLYTSSSGATSNNSANRCSAPAILNDDDDLFALIQRVQSTRLDEQRCHPPLQ